MSIVWAMPFAVAAAGTLIGSGAVARETRPNRSIVVGMLVGALLGAATVAAARGRGVDAARFAEGLALGGALLGAVPYALYWALGRLLAAHRWGLGVAFLVSLAGLYLYTFIALLMTLNYVACAPNAYECPV